MAKKTININGETFELVTAHNCYRQLYAGRGIFDCYDRPSNIKVNIYKNWLEWATDTGIDSFGVSSYNCNFFTLTGIYYAEDGDSYFIRITPAHNYATKIS